MELQIYNPTSTEELKPIEWNFEELKNWLSGALESYHGITFTDIQTAKAERAKLNSLSKAIDGKRIEMKKKYLEPYSLFEAQCKELTGMITAVSSEIDKQVKAAEEAEKQQKLDDIKAYYAEVIGDLADLLPYENLHNPKWLNKGTTLKSIRAEIGETISKVKFDLETIDKLVPERMRARVMSVYLGNLDISAALRLKDEIEAEEKRIEEYKRQQDEKRRAEEAEKAEIRPIEAPTEEIGTITPTEEEKPAEAQTAAQESLLQLDFRVWGTREQLLALKQYLVENGIKYGKVQ